MGEFFECCLAEGQNKRECERRVRNEFIGQALDTKDKYFGASEAAHNCWQDWVAYTDDQALLSDYFARELVEIQRAVNRHLKDPFQEASSLLTFQATLREVLDTIRIQTRKMIKVGEFASYEEIAAHENFGFRLKVQDYILSILDVAHRAVLTVNPFTTCAQVVDAKWSVGDKVVNAARFIKEYNFIFHTRWKLRADKFTTGLHMKEQDYYDVWDPIYGRCFETWKEQFVFDKADDLEVLYECFSINIVNNSEAADRPTLAHQGKFKIDNYPEVLKKAN